jgi:GTP-binding protein Era
MTGLARKFFVGEMIRGGLSAFMKMRFLSYSCTRSEFKEDSLIKIQADIIVQRETQKAFLLGEGGKMIRYWEQRRVWKLNFIGKSLLELCKSSSEMAR